MGNSTPICAQCFQPFKSYNPNPKFCSRACRVQSQTTTLDVERLRSLYGSGMTQAEVAHEFGVTQKVIYNAMRRHGIAARVAAKRDQWGPKNHMWRGDEASISAFHIRLYHRHGRLNQCDVCGTDDPAQWYDWANLTGRYEDITDYKRMCRCCHRQYDKSRREGGDAQ